MSQKEEKLKDAISVKFNGQTFGGVQIIRMNNITIHLHKPEDIDNSRMEEWNEVTFAASIRGMGNNMQTNYHIDYCSVGIAYDFEQREFNISEPGQHFSIRKM